MENYIVKFKNDLKGCQTSRKKLIPRLENERKILEIIINRFEKEINQNKKFRLTLPEVLSLNEIDEILPFFAKVFPITDTIKAILYEKKKTQLAKLEELKKYYETFCFSIKSTQEEHKTTQKIINAFENDKIKDPINDIRELLLQVKYIKTLTVAEISQIIGIAISFNNQYAMKNKNHSIQHLEAIKTLTQYYNPDGTLKYNEDVETFHNTIKKLITVDHQRYELFNQLFNFTGIFTVQALTEFLIYNNIVNQNNDSNTKEKNITTEPKDDYSIDTKTRKSLEKLKKYYKNGTIIEIPEKLDEFYDILALCGLDEKERTYIINLMNEKIAERKKIAIQKHLNKQELDIYENAIALLSSLHHSTPDTYVLKQYIEELQTIIEMLETETEEENKQYLLTEIPNIIGELSQICDKYTIKDNTSSNKFIFLLNKENIPFISDDIDSIDPSYRKAINSLLPKIDKTNQSQFRKILNPEELEYTMYEVFSQRVHLAFVEIDAGIYVIVGANVVRSGYKDLQNRLKANLQTIIELEKLVKNPTTRNEILLKHETYLESITEPKNNKENHINRKKLIPNN